MCLIAEISSSACERAQTGRIVRTMKVNLAADKEKRGQGSFP